MKRGTEFRLVLGEMAVLKGNFIEKRLRLVYTGAYDEYRYSIAAIVSIGNNSYAYNLYFTLHEKEIILPYGKIRVLDADDKSLYFVYQKD